MHNIKNNKYLVTAIVSTYNSEKFIHGCLTNLTEQTLYKNNKLEIIIIDSKSEQNEFLQVHDFLFENDHIKYIRTSQRETIYQAWNRGCKIARGEFITNANTDDRHRNDALERLAESFILHPNADVVYANSLITNNSNSTFATAPAIGIFLWPAFDRAELFRVCFIGPQPMWRKSLHEQHGFFDGTFKSAGDYEFWLRLASAGVHFQHVPECLGLYLMSQEGVEHSNQDLSFHESEIARSRHWNPKWGPRPTPGGSYLVPMRVSWSKWLTERPETPLVSVVIPTKDRPEMLREAVESVLNQTYPHVEAVVINDAGLDVKKHLSTIPNSSKISYIHLLQNSERSIARNCGIALANGNYIAYLDDDDIFYPNHIETLLTPLRTKEHRVAYSDSLMAQQSIRNGKYITYKKTCYYSQDFDYQKLLVDNYIPILCLMHEKKCIEKSGYFDTKISTHEDWDLWIRLAQNYKFLHLKSITSEYRMRNDNTNTTNSKFPKFLETYKYIYNKYKTPSTINNFTSLNRKKTLFAINLRTYDYICNLISDINKHTNIQSTSEKNMILKHSGANENQIISATIYLQSIVENDTSLQRQLLLRSIKADHENYLAWLALCKNYIEDGKLELLEKTLKTLIDANPLDVSLYDSLINISKVLNNSGLQSDMTRQKELMCHIIKENQSNTNT